MKGTYKYYEMATTLLPKCVHSNMEEEISVEWDNNVAERAFELDNGLDSTYYSDLLPTISGVLALYKSGRKVLDAGCGLGFLGASLLSEGYTVTGIDFSKKSIEYAKNRHKGILFLDTSIKRHTKESMGKYDTCVLNMVFHNIVNLSETIAAISEMLKPNGLLVYSIPHPYVWYKKHQQAYINNNQIKKFIFKVSKGIGHSSPITYIHRELSVYNRELRRFFDIVDEYELNRNKKGEPATWIGVCRKK